MRLAGGLAVALVTLAVPAGPLAFDRDDSQRRDASREAVSTLRPVEGQTMRALVRLSGHQGGPTRMRGIAVDVPAVQTIRIGLARVTCGQALRRTRARGAQRDINDIYLFSAPQDVRPDGTSLLEHEGLLYARLRSARSVAVVGDWNGDGRDDLGACGNLSHHDVDWGSRARGPNVWGESGGEASGTSAFLAVERVGPEVRGDLRVAAAGLQPSTEHGLGISRQQCSALEGREVPRPRGRLPRFTTDEHGSALASFGERAGFPAGGIRTARSIYVAKRAGRGIAVVACSPLRDGTIAAR